MARAGLAWGQQGTGDDAVVETVSVAHYRVPTGVSRFRTPAAAAIQLHFAPGATGRLKAANWLTQKPSSLRLSGCPLPITRTSALTFGVTQPGRRWCSLNEGAMTNTQIERRGGFGLSSYGS
jgi:hypothetical protein